MFPKKILVNIGVLILLLILFGVTVYGINSINEGYQIVAGAAATSITAKTAEGDVCKVIQNNNLPGYYYVTGAGDIFVPTKTTEEWSLFEANKPSSVSVADCSGPSAPQNLSGIAGDNQISLSWTAPTDSGSFAITGYNVYRSTTSGGQGVLLASLGVVLNYIDTSVTNNGATYYYKVSAINSVGEGTKSSEIGVKTSQYYPVQYTNAGVGADFTCTPYISGTAINYLTTSYSSKIDAVHVTKRSLENCLTNAGYNKTTIDYLYNNYPTFKYNLGYNPSSVSYPMVNNFWYQNPSAIIVTPLGSQVNGSWYVMNGTARYVEYKDVGYNQAGYPDYGYDGILGGGYIYDFACESVHLHTTRCNNVYTSSDLSLCVVSDATVPTYAFK